jgi:hypothetical protein
METTKLIISPLLVDVHKRFGKKAPLSRGQIAKLRKGDIAIVLAHHHDPRVPYALELRIARRDGDVFYGHMIGWLNQPTHDHPDHPDLVVFHACNIHNAIWTKRKKD